jgi:predicted nucleic acid-binding protein
MVDNISEEWLQQNVETKLIAKSRIEITKQNELEVCYNPYDNRGLAYISFCKTAYRVKARFEELLFENIVEGFWRWKIRV